MLRRVLDEFLNWFVSPLTLFVWVIASVVASIAGPFGTYDQMTPGLRAVFWSSLIGLSLVISYALAAASRVMLPDVPAWLRDALVIVVFSAIFTPLVIQAILLATEGEWAGHLSGLDLTLSVMAITTCVSLILNELRRHVPGKALRRVAAPKTLEPPVIPRLLRRLEGVAAQDVVRLTVEDHYVVVILADRTQHRILMRFGDAVEEMEGVTGYCVHRSHWVARAAIVSVIKSGGRERVALSNGEAVPVSRTYRQNLVVAGFLEPPERQAAE